MYTYTHSCTHMAATRARCADTQNGSQVSFRSRPIIRLRGQIGANIKREQHVYSAERQDFGPTDVVRTFSIGSYKRNSCSASA